MARREINIFGISFLDLLSGALAAVIILFVIVPKMSFDQQEVLRSIEEMNLQVTELNDLIEQSRNSIPSELYEQLRRQTESLQNTIDELTGQVRSLQERLAAFESENRRLREQVSQLEDSQRRTAELEEQVRRLQEQLDSRYTAWGIPSIGFIGSILCIAASLGYVNEAATPAGMNKITSMLSIAFDTTLVALFLSIILMWSIHYLQKRQDELFADMNSYMIENLINRFYK